MGDGVPRKVVKRILNKGDMKKHNQGKLPHPARIKKEPRKRKK